MATKVVKEEVIRVRIDKDLKDKFKKMCKDKKVTMSDEFKLEHSDNVEKRIVATEKKLLKLKEKINSKKKIEMQSRWRF